MEYMREKKNRIVYDTTTVGRNDYCQQKIKPTGNK